MQVKKKIGKILLLTAVIFIILLGVSVSTGNFFFLTDYHKTPLEAYNESMVSNPAVRQIGYFDIGDNTGLFIGEIDSDTFIVADMDVKGGRYSHKDFTSFYQPDYKFDIEGYDKVKTQSGTVKCIVAYKKTDLEKLKCDYKMKAYKTSGGQSIYLAVYE